MTREQNTREGKLELQEGVQAVVDHFQELMKHPTFEELVESGPGFFVFPFPPTGVLFDQRFPEVILPGHLIVIEDDEKRITSIKVGMHARKNDTHVSWAAGVVEVDGEWCIDDGKGKEDTEVIPFGALNSITTALEVLEDLLDEQLVAEESQ